MPHSSPSTISNMSRDQSLSLSERGLLDSYPAQVAPATESRKKGTLFLEARLKDGVLESGIMDFEECESYAKVLEFQLTRFTNVFELLEDVLADDKNASYKLGQGYETAKATLQSLKVIEYVGPSTVEKCFTTSKVDLKVQVFQLHGMSVDEEEKEDGLLGAVIPMPNARFEGVWDELVFEHELKADLIWMMTNILRFSRAFETHKLRRKLNPLILLHGPPGTGKTSLCLGLAQKISIRLSSTYKSTKLIQIKTAVLLSKYYSESAKHVDDIFNMIIAMCEERSDGFVCVLIDEVESIASSREFSTQHGESLDSMRATNALITGLDRTAGYSNVVFLFTSNMYDALEPAFLDRCGLKEFVGPPSMVEQYEILRSILEKLIACHVIQPAVYIPKHNDASLEAMRGVSTKNLPGCKLLEIVDIMHTSSTKLGTSISGRSLSQLPEKALMRYLREEDCDLDLALEFLRRCVLETLSNDKSGADDPQFEVREETKMEETKSKSQEERWSNSSDSLIETEPESIFGEFDILRATEREDDPDASTDATAEAVDGLGTKRKLDPVKPCTISRKRVDWPDEGDHGTAEKRTRL